jgi:predicted SAM-dependent methyltransferase
MPGNWSGYEPDVACDIRKLPYATDSVAEILAVHVIEHFYLWEVGGIFREWRRVLAPGGVIVIEVPCLNKVLKYLEKNPINLQMTMFALYGNPTHREPAMQHKWCYSREHLMGLMREDFREVREERCQFHVPSRDMRLVGIK